MITAEFPMPEETTRKMLFVKAAGRFKPVANEDILWLEAAGNYTRIHTRTAQYTVRSTLVALLETLPADRFVRIHKSTVVNVNEIAFLESWFSGEMIVGLVDGTKLRMSRTFKTSFRARFPFLA
jgi:two-component system, LytTR family, response regulator